MKYLRISLLAVLALFLVTSCGNKKQEAKSDDTFDLQSYIKAAEAVDPNLNKVDQVFTILELVNAEYYDVLTNDPYNAHSYKHAYPVAAANLGIYMTDIIYHFYGEADATMYLTFSAAQELAKHLGLDSEFGRWTIERLEGNAIKKDTITKMFNTLLMDSKKYTSEKETVFIHTAFLTGSFIEKVFITGSLLKQKMMNTDMDKEEEGDVRELLVIYLNQLNPATGILYDAFNQQKDQLQSLVVLATFEKLELLSEQLKKVKPELIVAPNRDITANKDLTATFDLVANLRNGVIASTQ